MPMPILLMVYENYIEILCMIKMKMLVLIKWSYKSSQFMLSTNPITL